ncbi:tryptophan--tRNA ligase [Mangrovactinospora gilvigrisea]|uniref:Tryptophan--tRNA ligase n=2 Tax=Mangrovactinospora gilvigrisea TaxID=1428644 RepID=A0A1J7C6V3_9ACTN|nr:tryptophan--tRNA ligase [Mangrovactinospora gilvigrisea]
MRIFSGVKPTGHPTLGNLLGAMQRWARIDQFRSDDPGDALFCVVDLHALTVPHEPAALRERTREVATLLLATGLDPERCTVFCQSHVAAHTRLTWIMESVVGDGELRRMVQYKEKSARQESVSTALLTYPALMAADILAYGAEEVPVGDDQRQHVELARDLAVRFNTRYGEVFPVPRAVRPPAGARVMNLQVPTDKMGKSDDTAVQGIIYLLDPPDSARRKVMRAVTDGGREVVYDPEAKPGVANLLDILSACGDGTEPAELATRYASYGALKSDVADAVVAVLEPLQARYREFADDPATIDKILRAGADRASALADPYVSAAYDAIGLLPPR